eukprot:CAMPEP_0176129030 /NCGR_PEP_ID=MMETSP0120_2-20121206/65223_1 /TAXON_ID=160619 /ORGANISM="Kryptoperidinium foliaceum, Strain CCMP 1326" /LENGTH=36 /DNA_ID= /DNA_START= /DNA_END= /DNA_ORIENTATION=
MTSSRALAAEFAALSDGGRTSSSRAAIVRRGAEVRV